MSKSAIQKCSVYGIRCKENGKIYIGRTGDVEKRVRQHFGELKNKKKRQSIKCVWHASNFQLDYDKYGLDAFEVYIIEENIPREKANEREAFWIAEYNSANPEFGYNRLTCNKRADVPNEFIKGLPPKMEGMYDN